MRPMTLVLLATPVLACSSTDPKHAVTVQVDCTITANARADGIISPTVAYQQNGTLTRVDW